MAKPNSANIQRVADKAHTAVDKAADVAEATEVKARAAASDVKAKADETIDTVKVASGNAQEKVTEYVNENPLQAIGIAFGAGLIASALLRK